MLAACERADLLTVEVRGVERFDEGRVDFSLLLARSRAMPSESVCLHQDDVPVARRRSDVGLTEASVGSDERQQAGLNPSH